MKGKQACSAALWVRTSCVPLSLNSIGLQKPNPRALHGPGEGQLTGHLCPGSTLAASKHGHGDKSSFPRY